MTTFYAGQVITAADLNGIATKFTGWGQRPSTSTGSASTTRVGVLRVDNMLLTSGHVYDVGYKCHRDSTVGTDTIVTELRYKAGGAAAVSTDTIIQGTQEFDPPSPSNFGTNWPVPATDTYSILLTFARNTGGGTATLFCDANRITELWVIDRGIITDTGVDT